jgi:hypothetical protein
MQQSSCSFFSTSIASVWTVETRCFLSSSNTGKKINMFGFLPVLLEDRKQRVSTVHTEAIEIEKYEQKICYISIAASVDRA